jgi:hypothetical protein
MADIIIGKLKVGDEVEVFNPMSDPRRYEVIRIEGNKAVTMFRKFNVKIYPGNQVYEFGKRLSSIYNNSYKAHVR